MDYLSDLKRDGFCIARDLIPPADITDARDSLYRTVADQLEYLRKSTPASLHEALSAFHGADIERYKLVLGALWRKAALSAIMRHANIAAFLKNELGWDDIFFPGGDVCLLMASDLKIPGGYFGLGAHQDFPSVQGSLDGLVAWIPLTDVDENSFPLEVVPGSHGLGLIQDVEQSRNGWQIPADRFENSAYKPVSVRAGDVVLMSYFTVHRSGLNGNRLRVALSTRYDNAAEETFIGRGYPTAYQRTVHREQYLPGFPTVEMVRKIWS